MNDDDNDENEDDENDDDNSDILPPPLLLYAIILMVTMVDDITINNRKLGVKLHSRNTRTNERTQGEKRVNERWNANVKNCDR